MDTLLQEIKNAVVAGKHQEIETLVNRAVVNGLDLDSVINDALIAAMDVIGERFGTGKIFVPEMLVSAMTMKKGLNLIKPRLQDRQGRSKGKIMLCTVKGDLHDIGKNLVGMMLEGAGFEVIDLGVDVTVESVIAEIRKLQPEILGLSALLTTTLPEMERVIGELTAQGLRTGVKVMVGGAPVNSGFAKKIGADAYGKDAAQAVGIAKKFAA